MREIDCAFWWVFAFRKNLPTKGSNDTQAVVATFSATKCLSKSEFGNKIPTLSELIIILPKIQEIYSSRLAGDLPQISKISPCFGESKLDTECCWYEAFP